MSDSVVVIGTGGHGKVVADIICCSGDKVVGFLDDNIEKGYQFVGFPILGTIAEYMRLQEVSYVIAIGNAVIREKIVGKMRGVKWYTAVHPSVVLSNLDTQVGEGTVIMANSVVNPGARIGKHCIINSGAVIEHDNFIEDFAHISVGAKLAGTVHIGKRTWIGIGAVVSNNISVCADCMVGAGGVVVEDIEEAGIYVGVPVKKRKFIQKGK